MRMAGGCCWGSKLIHKNGIVVQLDESGRIRNVLATQSTLACIGWPLMDKKKVSAKIVIAD